MANVISALPALNWQIASLAVRRSSGLVPYLSVCLRKYDELVGNGLPVKMPPIELSETGTVVVPAVDAGGGMSYQELLILARITKAVRPKSIFEIGTYNGVTVSVFILNSAPTTAIYTLDLPQEFESSGDIAGSDRELIASRRLAWVPAEMGLQHRYQQLLCDSLKFDPAEYLNSIDLALVDGAHDLTHVQADTVTISKMITDHGIVLWHDYGSKRTFRPLARYLEALGRRAQVYRIADTQLAWATGSELKKAVRTI